MEKGEALVSIAGPLMNFLIAIIFTIIYFVIVKFIPVIILSEYGKIIEIILLSTISVNVGLGVFNLIPIPPLDGSKIFRMFMPYNVKSWLDKYQSIFYMIFLILWVTGLLGIIVSPVIDVVEVVLFKLMGFIFGIQLI